MSDHIILVIGENSYGQLGLKSTTDALELVRFNEYNEEKYITSVYSGHFFTIFANLQSQHFFSCGYNLSGQCGVGHNELLVEELKPIEYFHTFNLRVTSICVSPSSFNTFWLTDSNQVFCTGPNRRYQLGLLDDDHNPVNTDNINEPVLCKEISSTCIDLQCGYGYNVALCNNINALDCNMIAYFCGKHLSFRREVPIDVVHLIVLFCYDVEVQSTGRCLFGANGHADDVNVWTKIAFFDEVQVQKIRTGWNHSLFLDVDGRVYVCGRNDLGQLGLGMQQKVVHPVKDRHGVQEVEYFSKHKILIREIACGWHHNLAIDSEDNVWAWGDNEFKQCGLGKENTAKSVNWPTKIEYFAERRIKAKTVKCGSTHSLVVSRSGRYFMFGDNGRNQCIYTENNNNPVAAPFCINEPIKRVMPNTRIKDVSLGCGNTKVILETIGNEK